MPAMIFVSGPLAGKQFPLAVGTVTLGRLAGCDVQVRDMRVSREHCRLWFDHAARSYMIADLGSANGTLVQGHVLTHEHPLRGDEIIQIGSTIFRFALHAPLTDPAAALEALRSHVRGQESFKTSHS